MGDEGGMNWEIMIDIYTLIIVENRIRKGALSGFVEEVALQI